MNKAEGTNKMFRNGKGGQDRTTDHDARRNNHEDILGSGKSKRKYKLDKDGLWFKIEKCIIMNPNAKIKIRGKNEPES